MLSVRGLGHRDERRVRHGEGLCVASGAYQPTVRSGSLPTTSVGVGDEEKSLRQVLQSLVSLTQGVTQIRNRIGVDHGAESVPTWVRPRHARLVVGSAHVWCGLMLETLADPDAPWRKAPK